ncbi:MAG: FtsX-like permease family protein [Anaerolineae bacterium]|nr:FtsX-like permease family protein [Anaerolineae bacterium]
MDTLLRLWGTLVIALRRIYAQKWLSLSILIGLVASIALAMSISIYADGVYYRILTEELARVSEGSRRPPFAFMFQYTRPPNATADWEAIQALDTYLVESGAKAFGLPQKWMSRYVRTDDFKVFAVDEVQYADATDPLFWVSFAFASDLEDHVTIVEGQSLSEVTSSASSAMEVLIYEDLALEHGLQSGETYIAYAERRSAGTVTTVQIPLIIRGIWRPRDPTDEYWFYDPGTLTTHCFTNEETFVNRIGSYYEEEIYAAVWYLVLDGSRVDTSDVNPLLARISRAQYLAAELLPNTRVPQDTVRALSNYRQNASQLRLMLYMFSIPILGLMVVFIGLVVGLSVVRQQNEIAVLRSRGSTARQVVAMAAVEALILGMLAWMLALPVSTWIAHLVSNTRSFLDFSLAVEMRVILSPPVIRTGLIAVILAVAAQVLPTISASIHTIVTYKQEQARAQRAPWWQRTWLDIGLLIPVVYGIYLMRQQGSIVLSLADGMERSNPIQNPLLLLIPSLMILAFALMVLRLIPYLMAVIALVAFRTKSIGLLMAARHLARTPSFYSAPMIMLVLTFSLSTFIASLAQTLDQHLHSQQFYAYGADMALVEVGRSADRSSAVERFRELGGRDGDQQSETDEEAAGPRFVFLPVTEHLKIPGVTEATRVGRYQAFVDVGGERQEGMFIGVDRSEFLSVSYWRDDFASASLGELMNRLAVVPDGVLVDRDFASRNTLNTGDTIRVEAQMLDQWVRTDVEIVGLVERFPTWYPIDDEGNRISLIVGNLHYLFEVARATYPYNVWLRVSPGADYETIVRDANSRGLGVIRWEAPLLRVASSQGEPERQGLFGVLSVGFIAAILLTVLGIFLYSLFSFRRRAVELGVLRAVGLSSQQMSRFLAWELLFLILTGMGVGTGLGIAVSNLFIPYLQIGEGLIAQYPPFTVEISWQPIIPIYILYGLLFLVALVVLVLLLLRMRIFNAVKLGETI